MAAFWGLNPPGKPHAVLSADVRLSVDDAGGAATLAAAKAGRACSCGPAGLRKGPLPSSLIAFAVCYANESRGARQGAGGARVGWVTWVGCEREKNLRGV